MSLRSKIAVALAAAALVFAGGASAQVVVLFARGPSAGAYPQGTVLPATKVLALKAGDQLELLDGAGSHVVTGPATIVAGHVDPKVRDQMIQLFLKAQQVRPGIAATRGFELQPKAPAGLWQLDASDSGVMCTVAGAPPVLWRSGAEGGTPVRIHRTRTDESRPVDWPAGAESADWPAGLPAVAGESYDVDLDDQSTVIVTLRAVAPPATGLKGLTGVLLDNGCFSQIDRLRSATVQ